MTPQCIAHCLASFATGGAEVVALNLAQMQVRQGLDVVAISLSSTARDLEPQFISGGIDVHVVPKCLPGIDATMVARLNMLLRRRSVELLHTHNPIANIYGVLAARLLSIPVVYSKHGVADDRWDRMILRRLASGLNAAVVAVSQATADSARDLGEDGAGIVQVIENGVDCDRFHPDETLRSEMRKELDLDESAFVVGTVGRLHPIKRHDRLLDAIDPLLSESVRLVICGAGECEQSLRQKISHMAGSAFVHFLGRRSDIDRVMNGFDVFTLSSESEGLPMVLLEAMASGLPIVATSVGGIPDVVGHASGLLVRSGDTDKLGLALKHVLSMKPRTLAEMGQQARQCVVNNYSLER